jgi:hypothetical protein
MTDLSLQASEIRQFLLGQLQDARAEQLEERIFANPDFGEEVDIVEKELIDDYLAGKLALGDREHFEQTYLKNAAGLGAVEYEGAFDVFIRAKLRGAEPLRGGESGQAETAPVEAGASLPSIGPEGPSQRDGLTWLGRLFTASPASAKLKIAAGLLILLGMGLWYLSPWLLPRPVRDDSASPNRRAWEAELARLNADAAAAAYIEARVTVDLMPMQRGGGYVPRLPTGDLNKNGLIKLRLHLTQSGPTRYRTVFLDDQRHELLAVPNLTVRNTPDGPQIWLLVPSKYFRPGDYQISLRAVNADGSEEEVNRYTLRVVEGK